MSWGARQDSNVNNAGNSKVGDNNKVRQYGRQQQQQQRATSAHNASDGCASVDLGGYQAGISVWDCVLDVGWCI